MKKISLPVIFSLLILTIMAASACADIIYLKNGRQIEGKIISQDDKKIWLITFGGAKIGIDAADVKEIVPKEFVVEQSSGAKGAPKGAAAAAKKQPGKTTYGTVTAEVAYQKNKDSGQAGAGDASNYTLTQYRDGKAMTFQRETYTTGALKSEISMQDGKRQGTFRSLYENGALKELGFYMDDKKSGEFKEYWPNGKLKSQILYKNGKETGLARFYHQNSILAGETAYKDGQKDGLEKTFYDTGQLETSQLYVNAKPMGAMEKYYPTGELQAKAYLTEGITTEYFKDGKMKSKLMNNEDKYIEYDQQGNVVYEGYIPENKKAAPQGGSEPAPANTDNKKK